MVHRAGVGHSGDAADPAGSVAACDARGASRRAGARRALAEVLAAGLAAACLAVAWRGDLEWLERRWSLDADLAWLAAALRLTAVALAIVLVAVARPRLARWAERAGRSEAAACARVGAAVVLALVTSELALRAAGLPRKHDLRGSCDDRLAEPDPRYGWVWKARYARPATHGWRSVVYAFDSERDRAGAPTAAPDPRRPTILFAGESIVAGHGLAWEETLPAIVGEALDVQAIDLGVDGYGSDQAFLRLADALPRYEHVVAVVTLFFPGMVDRVGWSDHPRLALDDHDVRVTPPASGGWGDLRLLRLAHEAIPYRAEDAIMLTGAVFEETARLAQTRGASALFVAPHLGRGARGDRYLVDELLVRRGLTVIDPDWRFEPIRGDGHPNAASTRRLAEAVVAALGQALARR